MKKNEFFNYYIPALEKALDYEQKNNFEVITPYFFIKDIDISKSMDQFENENYLDFENIFYLVALYFDAKIHNFKEIDGKSIFFIKKEIKKEIEKIKKTYPYVSVL